MASQPFMPCGRPTCKPFDYTQSAAPRAPLNTERLAHLDPEIVARMVAADEANDRATAFHEIGHVTAAIACGRTIESVQIAGQPHAVYGSGGKISEEIAVVCSLSGEVAEGIANRRIVARPREHFETCLARARAGEAGGCDICTSARVVLVGADASEDSATLVDRLIGYWRKAVDLFDTITMRAALGKLAGELQARRRMTGEEIAAVVVDAEALRAGRASLE